jgi:hypothetical protein
VGARPRRTSRRVSRRVPPLPFPLCLRLLGATRPPPLRVVVMVATAMDREIVGRVGISYIFICASRCLFICRVGQNGVYIFTRCLSFACSVVVFSCFSTLVSSPLLRASLRFGRSVIRGRIEKLHQQRRRIQSECLKQSAVEIRRCRG